MAINSTMSQDEDTPYRPAKSLPFELVQHTGIFFEEKLYTQALSFLLNILTTTTEHPTPAYTPPPHHLAIAATLLVHPSVTTRAKTPEEQECPTSALRLLRQINTFVGPLGARLNVAFAFTHFNTSRHGGRRRRAVSADAYENESAAPLTEDGGGDGKGKLSINMDMAGVESLWSRAADFWHVVGWAFNCSVVHRERWERWRVWLEYMCDVLEDDWAERMRLHRAQKAREEAEKKNRGEKIESPGYGYAVEEPEILRDSLICRYVTETTAGFGVHRRIMRAIFADGSTGALNEFREVFHNERKMPKKKKEDTQPEPNIKKREVQVNIAEDQYGDYYMGNGANTDEYDSGTPAEDGPKPKTRGRGKGRAKAKPKASSPDSEAGSPPAPAARKQTKRPRRGTHKAAPQDNKESTSLTEPDETQMLGPPTSLSLRQRLLQLLSTISQQLPKTILPLEDLYHLFVENIRPLPLPLFQAFVSPHALPYFTAEAQTTLCEFLLFRMRESAAPDTNEEYISQTKLEECFLPWAASTVSVVDNAKMSIVLEALIVLLAQAGNGFLERTEELRGAVMRGIERRAEKVQAESKRTISSRRYEDVEWAWLLESGGRLMFLVDEVI